MIDSDGDTNNWFQYAYEGTAYEGVNSAASASWYNNVVLTPDNWLITPEIQLPTNANAQLKFFIAAQDPDWPAEHYSVMISTTNTNLSSFTSIFSETLVSEEWIQKTISLADYSGQAIYIAFRHHAVTDQFFIKLDNINVESTNPFFTHFTPVWSGNGIQHMNFYINSAITNNVPLSTGDEIAVFDGESCVGMVKLYNLISTYPNGVVSIAASLDDPETPIIDGYTPNHNVTFKIWKSQFHTEYTEPALLATYSQGTSVFQIGETAIVQLMIDEPPVINLPDEFVCYEDGVFNLDFTAYMSNPGQNINDLMLTSLGSEHLNVSITGHQVTITPQANWFGTENLTFTVDDGINRSNLSLRSKNALLRSVQNNNKRNRLSSSDSVQFTINPINDTPIINDYTPSADTVFVISGNELLFSVSASDIENTELIYSWMVHGVSADSDSTTLNYLFTAAGTYTVKAIVSDGSLTAEREWVVCVSVGTSDLTTPITQLKQNYPNPFNPTTRISFILNEPSKVKIQIFNTKGQLVKELLNSYMISGNHDITWNGKDGKGNKAGSGVYFYRMETNKQRFIKKMIIIK